MGQGSGASSASILALSPRAEGLFNKILLMSGTAITPGAVRKTPVNATWTLDDRLLCRSFNSTELLDCFKKMLRDEILDAAIGTSSVIPDYEQFVPVVDGPGGVIPEPPEILATYRPKMPIMLGTTRDESSLRICKLSWNLHKFKQFPCFSDCQRKKYKFHSAGSKNGRIFGG